MPRANPPRLQVKRVYEAPARSDGCRVLVDRIWPRGVSKEAAKLDAWIKEIAPSAELRKWYGHEPSRWASFKRRYFRELGGQQAAIEQLLQTCSGRPLTLLFAAKDSVHNNAVALMEYVRAHLDSEH